MAATATKTGKSSKPEGSSQGQAVTSDLMKLHDLRPAPGARKPKTRVGRGEGSKGKTAGRGTKGTGARKNVPAGFEGGQTKLHMRLPKLRGFKNKFRTEYQVVNVAQIAALFPQGGTVTKDDLVAKGAVRKGQLVKVLGSGDISVAVTVSADAFSTSANEKIAAAGGSVQQMAAEQGKSAASESANKQAKRSAQEQTQ